MDPKRLFRKAALEKLSSPERLDVMMQVTSPAAWLALVALGAVLLVVLVWGIFGSISIKVRGQGILMPGEGIQQVTSVASGQIEEILVREREKVSRGQAVARLDTSQLEEEMRAQEATLDDALRAQEVYDHDDSLRLSDLEDRLGSYIAQKGDYDRLYRQGHISLNEKLTVTNNVVETQEQIRTTKEALLDRKNKAMDALRKLDVLKSQLDSQGQVVSPFDGYVVAIKRKRGEVLGPGDAIVTVEPEGEVEAVIYVPAGEGKKIHEDFTAQISPGGVRVEEWGFIVGEVVWVSDYPVSQAELTAELGDAKLAADLTGKSAKIEVRIRLVTDDATASGYKWTSSKGPDVQIRGGTVCSGNVTVEKKRPVSYVLPIFRKTLGV